MLRPHHIPYPLYPILRPHHELMRALQVAPPPKAATTEEKVATPEEKAPITEVKAPATEVKAATTNAVRHCSHLVFVRSELDHAQSWTGQRLHQYE